jgi:hypothetical protein
VNRNIKTGQIRYDISSKIVYIIGEKIHPNVWEVVVLSEIKWYGIFERYRWNTSDIVNDEVIYDDH